MRRLVLLAVAVVAGGVLSACASTGGPTDQEPRMPRHAPAAGWHSVSYHGIEVDVPDAATLTRVSNCGFPLPPDGVLVVPLFDGGASSCPAQVGGRPTTTPPPRTDLTVVLGTPDSGATEPTGPTAGGRHVDVASVGVRVSASGPADQVDAVLASVRVTPQDDHGCVDRIDPNVAPRNIDSPDRSILPVATSRIVVCEYGDTAGSDSSTATTLWLVASEELADDTAASVDALIRAAPPLAGADGIPRFGPVLRLLVLGADGNTRTLQAQANSTPEPLTDGRVTVGVESSDYPPIPTPV